MPTDLSRRSLIKAAGAAGLISTIPGAVAHAQSAPELPPAAVLHGDQAHQPDAASADRGQPYQFLNDVEADFVEGAVDRLIPADGDKPGALAADAARYIDGQLAGAWGAGARLYLQGPWKEGLPTQGYQLRFTPAELYRAAIFEIDRHVRDDLKAERFGDLVDDAKDRLLTELEAGAPYVRQVPSAVFFETLLANTIEGFLADPAYGGNRDMVGWKLIGFPGAYAAYMPYIQEYHGRVFEKQPLSIADLALEGGNDEGMPSHQQRRAKL